MAFDTQRGLTCDRCRKPITPKYHTKNGKLKTGKTVYVAVNQVDHEHPAPAIHICPGCEDAFMAVVDAFLQSHWVQQ